MLSKNTVKFIKSLHQKKYRSTEGMFLVEGEKSVLETIKSDFSIHQFLATEDFLSKHPGVQRSHGGQIIAVTQNQLESVGTYKSNKDALLVVRMKESTQIKLGKEELAIALDDVKDPGNLGTIIRIADWYGIRKILLSPQSAEVYNPKVIQSSMGSFLRIQWAYEELSEAFLRLERPVYGAFLNGENTHTLQSIAPGILLMGNESNGISTELERFITKKLTIPSFGQAESLNVAIATAVIADTIKRLTHS